ncbi:MAG TPA: Ig-like domain-containing protein [Prolixibacteraceae bacterium]|nr:Ig-like domain-containing protein [Prolixibacteraceae bacterium]
MILKLFFFFSIILTINTVFCTSIKAQDFDTDVPVGWAVVPGYGLESTTGGGNGETVLATTAEELITFTGSSQPLVIMVEGAITGEGRVNIKSNKTIMGAGADATLIGLELNISGESNIIIRNLTIKNGRDGIATRRSHHVWIDHCDVSACDDGAIDITDQADMHTVSWTRLHDHDKTMLINSGTDHPDDIGTLNTTLHHMFWDGSNQRNPRVGYGKVHVLNCFYKNNGFYSIGLHSQGLVYAEANYFDHARRPIHQMYILDPASIHHGFCESVNNIFNGNYSNDDIDDEGVSFRVNDYYLYDFIADDATDVPIIVADGAGPAEKYSSLGLLPMPGQGAIIENPTLKWTKGETATSYIVSFGITNPPPVIETVTVQEFKPEGLLEGTDYFWKVDQITPDGTIEGKLWMFRTAGKVPGQPTTTIVFPDDIVTIDQNADIIVTAEATDPDGTVTNVEFFEGKNSLGVDWEAPYEMIWPKASEGTHMLKSKVSDNEGNTYVSDVQFVDVRYRIAGLPDGYEFCSNEGEECSSSKVVDIAFGSNGNFTYKYTTTGSIGCNAEVFGGEAGNGRACYVAETPFPFVAIVSPHSGKTYKEGEKITFYVKTEDNEGWVDSIEFYANNSLLGVTKVLPNLTANFTWRDIPSGEYEITAKAKDNDENESLSESVVVVVENGSGFFNETDAGSFTLFPNPVTGDVDLNIDYTIPNATINLFDSGGQRILTQKISGRKHKLNMKNYKTGIYYITIIDNNTMLSRKVVRY